MAHPKNRKKKRSRRRANDPQRARAAEQREEARRREQEKRRLEQEAAERKQRIRKRIRSAVGPTLAVVAVFALALFLFRPDPEVADVEKLDEVEAVALSPGETHDYGTATPAGGPYAPEDPACGIFAEPVGLEDAVAAMRVGAVVLWHRPGDTVTAGELAEVAAGYESHVIVSPNDGITDSIVATAWTRRAAYEAAADTAAFIDTYRMKKGPEDGDCPG
jgi:hypothetical protein